MATKGHPETDGQSENTIRTLSSMIRSTVQKEPSGWDKVLCEMKYQHNSTPNKSTGLTPFEIDLGRISQSEITWSIRKIDVKCQAACDMVDRRRAFQQLAKDNLVNAVTRQTFNANKRRRDESFKVGDLVLLRTERKNASERRQQQRNGSRSLWVLLQIWKSWVR